MDEPITTTETGVLLGEWLLQRHFITQQQLRDALEYQASHQCRIGQALIALKYISEDDMTQALAEYLSLPFYPLDDPSQIDLDTARMLPESIARRYTMVAIGQQDDQIVITMADPLNVVAIDTVTVKLKRRIKVVISSAVRIATAIEQIYDGSDVEEQRLRDLIQNSQVEEENELSLVIEEEQTTAEIEGETEANQAPVVRFVDLLLSQAIKSRASDLHIEPQDKSMVIRMRVDGGLKEMVPPPRRMQAAVTTRIKILSRMDIAERRLPQDGRFKVKAGRGDIDIRVSAIPTIYGEKIVMRILDKSAVSHDLDRLGIEPNNMAVLQDVLSRPHGIVIVTGPTGSGKSTTLYAALNHLKDPTRNIVTVEDPVEYRLNGINQIQVRPDIDLDFARCLRAILRQDPDIILIGEIRDKETVEIAMKASLTGHLVLSTFHTNDAPSALTRLIHMGIEPYLLASTLNLVMAQRLVRRVCEHCTVACTFDQTVLSRLKVDPERIAEGNCQRGSGCRNCGGTGYQGRLPIFEFLPLDRQVREGLISGISEAQIRQIVRERGYGSLAQSGVGKVLEGLTTPDEVLRVTIDEQSM